MKLGLSLKQLKQGNFASNKKGDQILNKILKLDLKKLSEKILLKRICVKFSLDIVKFLKFL